MYLWLLHYLLNRHFIDTVRDVSIWRIQYFQPQIQVLVAAIMLDDQRLQFLSLLLWARQFSYYVAQGNPIKQVFVLVDQQATRLIKLIDPVYHLLPLWLETLLHTCIHFERLAVWVLIMLLLLERRLIILILWLNLVSLKLWRNFAKHYFWINFKHKWKWWPKFMDGAMIFRGSLVWILVSISLSPKHTRSTSKSHKLPAVLNTLPSSLVRVIWF